MHAPAVVAAVAAPVALALVLLREERLDLPSSTHFWFLVLTSGVAWLSALALSVLGARRSDGRVVLMGTAFAGMAALLFVHGLATPGFLAEMNGVIKIAGAAVLPVGGLVLALTTLPSLRRPQSVRPLLTAEATLVAAIIGLGCFGLIVPDALPALPESGSFAAAMVALVGLAAFSPVVFRAARTYALTRRAADLAVVTGTTWLALALPPQLMLEWGNAAWWLGHGLELVGIALAGGPVALDLIRDRASRPLLGDLRASEMVAAEEAFLGSRVRALMVLLAKKDPSTEEHTRRVAALAVEVGEELGLPAARLRELAIGGLLHDMGKLAVPDEILGKPGALTDEEFAVIREHPANGVDLLRELGGFPPSVLRLVHDHHERLDGSGYPRRLTGDQMGLETRILMVCDVYDALVSDRVYRAAWTAGRAHALLREEAGTKLDANVVEALERVTRREPAFVTDIAPAPAPVPGVTAPARVRS